MFGLVVCAAAIEFERQQQQLRASPDYNYYDGRTQSADDESGRTHHGSHKLKKMKKRLLLQCLRQQMDTGAVTGRFLIPFAVQNTNVNVGGYGDPQYGSYGGGGCMQITNDHKPLLEQLLATLVPSTGDSGDGGGVGSRYGLYADWNRYARQFDRNFIRPLYRLF